MSNLPNTVQIFDDGSGVFSDSIINQVQADISKGLIINNFPPGSTFTLTDTNGNTFNFTNNIYGTNITPSNPSNPSNPPNPTPSSSSNDTIYIVIGVALLVGSAFYQYKRF